MAITWSDLADEAIKELNQKADLEAAIAISFAQTMADLKTKWAGCGASAEEKKAIFQAEYRARLQDFYQSRG